MLRKRTLWPTRPVCDPESEWYERRVCHACPTIVLHRIMGGITMIDDVDYDFVFCRVCPLTVRFRIERRRYLRRLKRMVQQIEKEYYT